MFVLEPPGLNLDGTLLQILHQKFRHFPQLARTVDKAHTDGLLAFQVPEVEGEVCCLIE